MTFLDIIYFYMVGRGNIWLFLSLSVTEIYDGKEVFPVHAFILYPPIEDN